MSYCSGSSPLARGLQHIEVDSPKDIRIIPARAGFTGVDTHPPMLIADHPRSRGVYARDRVCGPPSLGSSPLARGLLPSINLNVILLRIIPARAGFTWRAPGTRICSKDHPRSRGVYTLKIFPVESIAGSSPLARGLRISISSSSLEMGIIPARAGFTSPTGKSRGRPRDHPRSRGVYPVTADTPSLIPGSSPLARGLRHPDGRGDHQSGIIPARAGFTSAVYTGSRVRADHPRSRGVYIIFGEAHHSRRGSSPLARGLHPLAIFKRGNIGIIPARAGFTRECH